MVKLSPLQFMNGIRALDASLNALKKEGRAMMLQVAGEFRQITKTESRKEAPTKEELWALLTKLGYRIKRKSGSPVKEIRRRVRARGTFARGWKDGGILSKDNGRIIQARITNAVKYSKKVDEARGVSARSKNKTQKRAGRRIARIANAAKTAYNRSH